MEIDLGKVFSWLFKRKKKDKKTNKNIEWIPLTADAVLNCCEQIGAFEEANVQDETIINNICEEIANTFNAVEKSEVNLKNALIEGFGKHSLVLNNKKASMFVDCYLESYIYGE